MCTKQLQLRAQAKWYSFHTNVTHMTLLLVSQLLYWCSALQFHFADMGTLVGPILSLRFYRLHKNIFTVQVFFKHPLKSSRQKESRNMMIVTIKRGSVKFLCNLAVTGKARRENGENSKQLGSVSTWHPAAKFFGSCGLCRASLLNGAK